MNRIAHWIGGSERAGVSGRVGPVFNPATGEQTAEVDLASAEEVAQAIAVAKEAAQSWRSASLAKRTTVLFKFRELLAANTQELAAIITSEHGKVLSDAAGEVARGLENAEFATGIP